MTKWKKDLKGGVFVQIGLDVYVISVIAPPGSSECQESRLDFGGSGAVDVCEAWLGGERGEEREQVVGWKELVVEG